MKQLFLQLLALLVSALKAQREDTTELQSIKKQNEDLQEKLRQEDLDDDEIEELAPRIDEAIKLAAAARTPSQDQIDIAGRALSGVGVSQDPAQPAGSPAPGNPEAEARMKEVEKEDANEKDQASREDRIETLVNENDRSELVTKAEKAGVTVGSHDNKETIATAIVNKEDEGK
jgi:hypothetical protein